MSFYDSLEATASTLLTKYGRSVTRRRSTVAPYDPGTGEAANTGPTDVDFKGAPLPFKDGVTEVNGTLVQADDQRLLLEAAAAPLMTDVIIIGGDQFSVLSIKDLKPGGSTVIYSLHLRKS